MSFISCCVLEILPTNPFCLYGDLSWAQSSFHSLSRVTSLTPPLLGVREPKQGPLRQSRMQHLA